LKEGRLGRVGLSTAAVTILLVSAVILGGIVGYFLLIFPAYESVSTATAGASASSTYARFPTESSSASVVTTYVSNSTYPGYFFNSPNGTTLVRIFSQIEFNSSSFGSASNESGWLRDSFRRTGTSMLGGVQVTDVNFTTVSSYGNNSAVVYFDRNWTAVGVLQGGVLNGTDPEGEAGYLTGTFREVLGYNAFFANPTTLSEFKLNGTSTQKFGNVTMDVTTFSILGPAYGNTPPNRTLFSLGRIPNSDYSLVVYWKEASTTQGGGTQTVAWQLVSASLA